MTHPDLAQRLTPPVVRIVIRILTGAFTGIGLWTAAQGEHFTADPETQVIVTLLVSAGIEWAVERWWLKDRATGGPT